MPREVRTVPAVVKFAKNAPKKMPGHTRTPKIRRPARAIPVGAHTAVALGLTKANFSPSFAAPKYTAASAAAVASSLRFMFISWPGLDLPLLLKSYDPHY